MAKLVATSLIPRPYLLRWKGLGRLSGNVEVSSKTAAATRAKFSLRPSKHKWRGHCISWCASPEVPAICPTMDISGHLVFLAVTVHRQGQFSSRSVYPVCFVVFFEQSKNRHNPPLYGWEQMSQNWGKICSHSRFPRLFLFPTVDCQQTSAQCYSKSISYLTRSLYKRLAVSKYGWTWSSNYCTKQK